LLRLNTGDEPFNLLLILSLSLAPAVAAPLPPPPCLPHRPLAAACLLSRVVAQGSLQSAHFPSGRTPLPRPRSAGLPSIGYLSHPERARLCWTAEVYPQHRHLRQVRARVRAATAGPPLALRPAPWTGKSPPCLRVPHRPMSDKTTSNGDRRGPCRTMILRKAILRATGHRHRKLARASCVSALAQGPTGGAAAALHGGLVAPPPG
jgi:hypothetical protein